MVNDSRLKIFESIGIKKNTTWLLKKFDLFGNKFTFEEDDNQSFRTILGGLISLLLIIAISVLGFIFGVEIYERKLPIVSTSQEVLDNSRVMLNEFPIMFSFIGFSWVSEYSKYLSVSSYMLERGTDGMKFTFFNNLEPCSLDRFKERPKKVYSAIKTLMDQKELQGEYLFCLPKNDTIYFQNAMGNSNDTYITTNIASCFRNCSENVASSLSSMTMKIYYLDSYIDPKNFSDPDNYYFGTYYSKFAPGYNKAVYVSVARNILKSDNGWIMEDIKDTEYISLKNIRTDVSVSNYYLATIYIDSPQFRQKVNRNYTTVQDVLAKVGGLFNGFLIIIQVLLYHYTRFKYISSVFESTWLNKVVDTIALEKEAAQFNIKLKENKTSLGIQKSNNPTSLKKVNQEQEVKKSTQKLDLNAQQAVISINNDEKFRNNEIIKDNNNILHDKNKKEDSKKSVSEYNIKSNESSSYDSNSSSENDDNYSQIEITPKPNSTANVNFGLRKHFFPSLNDIVEDNKEIFESRIEDCNIRNSCSNNSSHHQSDSNTLNKSILHRNKHKLVGMDSEKQNPLIVIGESHFDNSFLDNSPQKTKHHKSISENIDNNLFLNDNSIGIMNQDKLKNISKMSYSTFNTKDNTNYGSLMSNQLINPSSFINLSSSKINNKMISVNSIQIKDLNNNDNSNSNIDILNNNSNNRLSKFNQYNQINQSEQNKSGLNSSIINLNNSTNLLNNKLNNNNNNFNNGRSTNQFNNSISNINNTINNNNNNMSYYGIHEGTKSIIKKLNSANDDKLKKLDLYRINNIKHNKKNNIIESISGNIFTNFKATPRIIKLEDLYFDLIVEKFQNLNNYWHYLASIFCCCSRYPFKVYDFIYSKAYLTVSFYYYSKKSFDYEWDKEEVNNLKESISVYKKSQNSIRKSSRNKQSTRKK